MDTSPSPPAKARRTLGFAVLAFLACVAHGYRIPQPIVRDDNYVMRALLSSTRPTQWLAAFDYDAPCDEYMPWWTGFTYQRRFVRLPPNVLLKGESMVFGWNPSGYHAVTLLILILTSFVMFGVLSSTVSSGAALLALIPAVCHPALGEIVRDINCQPLAVAGLFSAVALWLWTRDGDEHAARRRLAALGCAFLAMISYEAAVLLPVLLVGWDLLRPEREEVRRSSGWRWSVMALALFVLYAPIAIAWRVGVTHPDTGPLRAATEIAQITLVDLTAYAAKILCAFDPSAPFEYSMLNRLGLIASVVLVLAVGLALFYLGERRRLAWIGLFAAALFLGPPVLVRAAVAYHNQPSLRQLALVMLLGVPLLLAGAAERRRAITAVLVLVWGAVGIVQSNLIELRSHGAETRQLTELVDRLLAGRDRRTTLIVAGAAFSCGYYPTTAWHDGPMLWAFPPGRGAGAPSIKVIDDHTLEARTQGGFRIPLDRPEFGTVPTSGQPKYGPGGLRQEHVPPFGADRTYRHPGMSVEWTERNAERPTVLRAHFDEPLSRSTVLVFDGCKGAELLRTQP